MNCNNKCHALFEISTDWQKLSYLNSISDMQAICKHIQKIEVKYSQYMFWFLMIYPKPFFLNAQVEWCSFFLRTVYCFEMLFKRG